MAIKVRCACGKALSVEDKHAGKRVRCPKCKEPVRVPTQLEAEEEDAKVSYGVEGVSAEGKELPKKGAPKKPGCYFCDTKKNVKIFRVYTATLGPMVDVRAANDTVHRGASYDNLTEHEVPVCVGCATTVWRRLRHWVLLTAVVEFIAAVIFAIGGIWFWSLLRSAETRLYFYALLVSPFLAIMAFLGLIGTLGYYFSKVNFEKAESAIAQAVARELDPETEAWLSLKGFQSLQPQQINGEVTQAGLASPPAEGD